MQVIPSALPDDIRHHEQMVACVEISINKNNINVGRSNSLKETPTHQHRITHHRTSGPTRKILNAKKYTRYDIQKDRKNYWMKSRQAGGGSLHNLQHCSRLNSNKTQQTQHVPQVHRHAQDTLAAVFNLISSFCLRNREGWG